MLGETSGMMEPQSSLFLNLIARCYSELTQTYKLTENKQTNKQETDARYV